MPHFDVIVITSVCPPAPSEISLGAILEESDKLLNYYDRFGEDDTTMEAECRCLVKNRRDYAKSQAELKFGDLNILRSQFLLQSNQQDHTKDYNDESWALHVLPFMSYTDELIRTAGDVKPDCDCRMCKGKGKLIMPRRLIEGKFDSYAYNKEIGNLHAMGSPAVHLDDNTRDARRLVSRVIDMTIDSLSPFAVITPDGVWHGYGEIDQFGVIRGKIDNWDMLWQSIAVSYPENIAILATCHNI